MTVHEEALVVPFTPEQMFDLVADVERYPEFVPGYCEARILRREGKEVEALQRVGVGAISARFHSFATFDRPHRIHIRSTESPFDALEIEWLFQPAADGGCRIVFRAHARLAHGLTARLLAPWFDRLAEFVPAAFVARARTRYGQRSGPGPT